MMKRENVCLYYCKICRERAVDKAALVDHLREEHEILEALSYAASTMIMEENRDGDAEKSFTLIEEIRRKLGESRKRCPDCGSRVKSTANFCDSCGASLMG
jgi:tRNA(Ile2) C34 agmatinyltransferase TiaS